MITRFQLSFLFVLILLVHPSGAQNLWINAMPMQYNPSFAGNTPQSRIALTNTIGSAKASSDQGHSNINQNYLSFDKFISRFHTGVGAEIRYTNFFEYPSVRGHFLEESITLAPKFSFKGKYTLSPSIQITNRNTVANYSSLNWPDADGPSKFTIGNSQLIMKTGLLFNTKNFFAGASFVFMNKVYKGYKTGYFPVNFIAGYSFRKNEQSALVVTPVVLINQYQDNNFYYVNTFSMLNGYFLFKNNPGNNTSVNLYLTVKYKKAVTGLDLNRNVMLGYESDKTRLMLVLRYKDQQLGTIHKVKTYSAQLSFRYLFGAVSAIN